MDYKSLASNFAMAQTFLAGAGLLAPHSGARGPLANLKAHIIAVIVISSIGIAFLLAGLYLYLMTIMQPYQVCLIMGAAILALGLTILGIRMFALYMLQRRIKSSINGLYKDVKGILNEIVTETEKPIIENPKVSLILALLAGFILSKKLLKD